MQNLGNNNNCNIYGRNFIFATSKIFERFCSQIPKIKHCHEFTKGDFSQSSLKEVTHFNLVGLVVKGLKEKCCLSRNHYRHSSIFVVSISLISDLLWFIILSYFPPFYVLLLSNLDLRGFCFCDFFCVHTLTL